MSILQIRLENFMVSLGTLWLELERATACLIFGPRLGGDISLALFDDKDPPGYVVPWDVYEKMTGKKRPEVKP